MLATRACQGCNGSFNGPPEAFREEEIRLPWVEQLASRLAVKNLHTLNNDRGVVVYDLVPGGS